MTASDVDWEQEARFLKKAQGRGWDRWPGAVFRVRIVAHTCKVSRAEGEEMNSSEKTIVISLTLAVAFLVFLVVESRGCQYDMDRHACQIKATKPELCN